MAVFFDWMPQRLLQHEPVFIPTPVTLALQVTGVFELSDDALDRSFRDADKNSNVAKDDVRVASQANQNVRMVGEKCPIR
jgi:hypothetical protein